MAEWVAIALLAAALSAELPKLGTELAAALEREHELLELAAQPGAEPSLMEELEEVTAKKGRLGPQEAQAKAGHAHAEKVVAALQGDAERWRVAADEASARLASVHGDTLLAAAAIAFLGAHAPAARSAAVRRWRAVLAEAELPCAPERSSLTGEPLCSAAQRGGWAAAGVRD